MCRIASCQQRDSGEPALIQGNWRPAEGKQLCSAAQRPASRAFWSRPANGASGASKVGVDGPPPWPWPGLWGIEMGRWQPLGDGHSDQGPGSPPALRLPLALGLIVSRWQMPSRQLSFKVYRAGGTVEEGGRRGPCAPCISPLPCRPGSVPPLGRVLCYRHWWVTGSQTQEYCCLHNCSSNSNKQFSLPKSDRIIRLAILLQYQPHIQNPGLHTLPILL